MNLAERNECLTEEVRQLRAAMVGKRVGFPFEWNLTIAQERVLNSLYTSPTLQRTHDALLFASRVDDEVDLKMIQVHIHNIRKKLNPLGIVIRSIRGEGYALTRESAAIIKAALA